MALAFISKAMEDWIQKSEVAVENELSKAEVLALFNNLKPTASFMAEASIDLIIILAKVMRNNCQKSFMAGALGDRPSIQNRDGVRYHLRDNPHLEIN